MQKAKLQLNKISDFIWEIPKNYRSDMRVPARIFASENLLKDLFKDRSLEQLINVATLPGIQKWALSMPDIHEGYGFPIGGVAAMDAKEGVISPGGIGYDINCGVRIIKSACRYSEIKDKISDLATEIFNAVPSGLGRGGQLKLSGKELDDILSGGIKEMKRRGYATDEDQGHCESGGWLEDADPSLVSQIAKKRGGDQLGTIGSGNHFVEVQKVDEIFDQKAAEELGIFKDQVVIMIHCGSRGLGHQNATDYIKIMMSAMPKYGIKLPDPELACAPFSSDEGQSYWKAMSASANFAWANRQLITWEVRGAWKKIFGDKKGELQLIYDVAHNLAKLEEYPSADSAGSQQASSGQVTKMVVHRKGATRSFPGQPVLIPGSMGTASFVLIGQPKAMEISFGSSCHGAGRVMSRTKAKKMVRGSELKKELEKRGISVRSESMSGLAEEAPVAYKDVDEVVNVVHGAGLAKKVARMIPVAVIKG